MFTHWWIFVFNFPILRIEFNNFCNRSKWNFSTHNFINFKLHQSNRKVLLITSQSWSLREGFVCLTVSNELIDCFMHPGQVTDFKPYRLAKRAMRIQIKFSWIMYSLNDLCTFQKGIFLVTILNLFTGLFYILDEVEI